MRRATPNQSTQTNTGKSTFSQPLLCRRDWAQQNKIGQRKSAARCSETAEPLTSEEKCGILRSWPSTHLQKARLEDGCLRLPGVFPNISWTAIFPRKWRKRQQKPELPDLAWNSQTSFSQTSAAFWVRPFCRNPQTWILWRKFWCVAGRESDFPTTSGIRGQILYTTTPPPENTLLGVGGVPRWGQNYYIIDLKPIL